MTAKTKVGTKIEEINASLPKLPRAIVNGDLDIENLKLLKRLPRFLIVFGISKPVNALI